MKLSLIAFTTVMLIGCSSGGKNLATVEEDPAAFNAFAHSSQSRQRLNTDAKRHMVHKSKTMKKMMKAETMKGKSASPEPTARVRTVSLDRKSMAPKQMDSTRIASGYYIQLSAETERRLANEIISQLAAFNYNGVVQIASVHGTTYYRVLVGPYRNRKLAKSKISGVLRTGVTNEKPFLRKLG